MHLKIPPLLLAISIAILMLVSTWLLPQFRFDLPLKNIIALFIAMSGTVICALAVISFRRDKTTVNPTQPERASALIITGVYRLSRNPMYLGFLLFLIAWAIYLGHISAWLLGPPVFVGYMNKFQIVSEEEALFRIFTEDFAAYKQTVRRWI